VSLLNTQTPYKYIANSVSKFGGILFTRIRLTAVACCASRPLKVRLSFLSQNVPPPPPTPLYKHRYIRRHFITAHFSQLTNTVLTQLAHDYHLLGSSPWVEISTLAYEGNSSCWPEMLSVAYCTHIIQTKFMLKKSEISTKLHVYSYRRAHRHASCSAGVICSGCGVVICNIQPSM
jgi:hypothetical protein